MHLRSLILEAGWAMVPIYACSLVLVAVFVRKLLDFRAAGLGDTDWLDPILGSLRCGDFKAAAEAADRVRHPAARPVAAVTRLLRSRPDRAEAEAARLGSLEIQALESNVRLLSLLAQVAPLLGLFGTVVGMVQLFIGLMGSGMGNVDAAMLSSGIWKALLTTAAGLIVAVPALAGHSYLISRTDHTRLQMSDAVQRVLTAAPPRRKRKRLAAAVSLTGPTGERPSTNRPAREHAFGSDAARAV